MSSKTGERARGGTSGQAPPRVAVSKSRGDKSRSVTVAPLPPVTVDIIPGRFSEDDWLSMVVAEDGEDVVGDMVDSLMDRVMDACLLLHLQHQVVPYAVAQARDVAVRMVQWTFVPRDEGDAEPGAGGNSQQEPRPCPHDSWAQGCVPLTPPPPQVSPRHPITDIPEETPQPEDPPEERPPGTEDPPEERPPGTEDPPEERPPGTEDPPAPPEPRPIIKPTPPAAPPKPGPRYRPHRGPLRSAGLKNITKTLEETEKELEGLRGEDKMEVSLLPTSLHNILKIQLGRPPQKKDATYDQAGNLLSVPRVVLSRLPRHHVRPQVEVLSRDPGKPRAGGPQPSTAVTSQTPPHGEDLPGRAPVSTAILLDTMPLTHGVVLREGNTTERGTVYSLRQRETVSKEGRRQLRPIRASAPLPRLSVEQLIKNSVPQVQPLVTYMSC